MCLDRFSPQYGPAVDMWSVGCILAELLYESPILPGTHEKEQLNLIYSLCGTPTDESWPDRTEVRNSEHAFSFQREEYPSVEQYMNARDNCDVVH